MTENEKNRLQTDPVCRMKIKEEEAITTECDGVIYFLCSKGCRDKFMKERTCARTASDLIIIGGRPRRFDGQGVCRHPEDGSLTCGQRPGRTSSG
jgi:YHS domain-containing protein